MRRWTLFALLAVTAWGSPGGVSTCGTESAGEESSPYPTAKMPPEVQKARQECNGRRFADFISRDGSEFHDVIGRAADDSGFRFSHRDGAKFLRYEDLPPELQREFLGVNYPNMSPEVVRRRAIHDAQRRLENLEAQLERSKAAQKAFLMAKEGHRMAQEQSLAEAQAKIQEDIAKTRQRITELEEEHRKRKGDLASFDRPEAIAARRAEMKKQQAEAASIGRTLAEDTPEKFDARQREAMQNSIRRTAEQIASMKMSLASSRSETSRADQARAKVSKQIAEGERQFTKDIELAEKRIADARKKLADQIEESTRKGDDPTAFDRYCEDHGFPRQ